MRKKTKFFRKCSGCGKAFKKASLAIILNGGSLKKVGEDKFSSDDELDPFLTLWYHEDTSKTYLVMGVDLDKPRNHTLGQFEFYFCSFGCIKKWFFSYLKELKSRVLKEKRKRSGTKYRK